MKLFDLCTDILIDVFTVWIPCEKTLCALDSSLTNTSLRVLYLSLIHMDHCIFLNHYCGHPDWFKWILLRGMRISSITVNKAFDDTTLEVLKRLQKSIRHFRVYGIRDDFHLITDLFGNLVNLTRLGVDNDILNGNLVTILDVIPNPELLKELNLYEFSSASLSVASHRCVNLEKLSLYSMSRTEFDFDGSFSKLRDIIVTCPSEITNKVIKGCQAITKLDVYIVSGNYSSLSSLRSLKELIYKSFSIANLVKIVSNNKQLFALTLEGQMLNVDEVISAITQYCKSFEYLKVNCDAQVSNVVITNFVNRFSSLKYLCLSHTCVNKQFVDSLDRNCLILEELVFLNDVTFTDEFVLMVTRGCVNLRKLTLLKSRILTNNAILHIGVNCDRLVELTVWVDNMTLDVFKTFENACPRLRTVNMRSNYGQSYKSLGYLNDMRKGLEFKSGISQI